MQNPHAMMVLRSDGGLLSGGPGRNTLTKGLAKMAAGMSGTLPRSSVAIRERERAGLQKDVADTARAGQQKDVADPTATPAPIQPRLAEMLETDAQLAKRPSSDSLNSVNLDMNVFM